MAAAAGLPQSPSSPTLTFQLAQSSVAVEFWKQLATLKLNVLRLSEEPIPITGTFTAGTYEQIPSPVQLDSTSFASSSQHPQGHVEVPGQLANFNTLEQFRGLDRPGAMHALAAQIWRDICSGAAEQDPALLWRFGVFSFADLKKFSFTYWHAPL